MMKKPCLFGPLLGFSVFVSAYSRANETMSFTGNWKRNDRYSQSALSNVELAFGEPGNNGAGGKAFNAFSPSGLLKQIDRVALRNSLFDYARRLQRLTIEQKGIELHVTVGDEYVVVLYLDGKKHVRQLADGLTLEVTAHRDGDSVSVEQKSKEGDTIKELYSLMSNGKELALLFQLKSRLIDNPVMFRLVYDRDDAEE